MREKDMRDITKVRSDYDMEAETHDKLRFGTPGGRYADNVKKRLVARAVKGPRVLDVGTATG